MLRSSRSPRRRGRRYERVFITYFVPLPNFNAVIRLNNPTALKTTIFYFLSNLFISTEKSCYRCNSPKKELFSLHRQPHFPCYHLTPLTNKISGRGDVIIKPICSARYIYAYFLRRPNLSVRATYLWKSSPRRYAKSRRR